MSDIQTQSAGGEFHDGAQPQRAPEPLPPIDQHPPTPAVVGAVAQPVSSERRAFARWWAVVLDGSHDWGSVDVSPTRHGVTQYRLVLFPPGLDIAERRLLRARRAWPTWGAVVWVASQIVLSSFLTPPTAFAASTIAYLAAGAVLFARVAELRARVLTLSVVRIAGYPDPHSATMFTELKSLVATLCQADAQRDRGQSSPVEHEAIWWQVYDRLSQNQARPVTP
ncbi:MAG: DUF6611 family protein [Mycobacterium sp.]